MYKNQDIYLFKSYSSVIFKPSRTSTEEATKMAAKYFQSKSKDVFLIILENNCTLVQ